MLPVSPVCQCHGTDGRANGDIESFAGENAFELYQEILETQVDDDTDEIMHFQVKGYAPEQRLIAVCFASVPSDS